MYALGKTLQSHATAEQSTAQHSFIPGLVAGQVLVTVLLLLVLLLLVAPTRMWPVRRRECSFGSQGSQSMVGWRAARAAVRTG